MIKNELKTTSRQLLLFLALAALLAVLIPLTGGQARGMKFGEIFLPYFQVMTLLAATLFGLTIFSEENRQRGFDYLLSLPLSRSGLLAVKALTRLAGLLPLYFIALISTRQIGTEAALFTPFSYSLLFFSLFVIGLTFSASSANLVVNFSLGLSFFLLFYSGLALIVRTAFLNSGNSFLQELTPGPAEFMRGALFFQPDGRDVNWLIWLTPALLLAACAGALVWRFQAFDPVRRGRYNLRLFASLGLLLASCIFPAYLLSGLAVETTLERRHVELSSGHCLLVKQGAKLRLFKPGLKQAAAEFRLDGHGFEPIYDDQRYLYFGNYLPEKNGYLDRIGLLDKQEKRLDWVLTGEPGEHLISSLDSSGSLIYVLRLKKRYFQGADLELLEIKPGRGQSRSIVFPEPLKLPGLSYQFAVLSTENETSLIIGQRKGKPASFDYYRLSSRGGGELLLTGVNRLTVIEDLLLFSRGREFQVARLGPEGLETIYTNPDGAFYFRGRPGGGPRVFATRADRLFRLDLRDFSLEEYRGPNLDGLQAGFLQMLHQGEQDFIMVESLSGSSNRETSNYYRVNQAGLHLLKSLDLELDPGRDWVIRRGNGLIIYRQGRLQVYAYPGFDELSFPAWR